MVHKPQHPINRAIIELCCGPDSRMGESSKESKGCMVLRVTEADDLTKAATVNYLIAIINRFKKNKIPTLLWASIPCTGGTRCTNLNWARGIQKTRDLILSHIALYKKRFHGLRRISSKVSGPGDTLCYRVARELQILASSSSTSVYRQVPPTVFHIPRLHVRFDYFGRKIPNQETLESRFRCTHVRSISRS